MDVFKFEDLNKINDYTVLTDTLNNYKGVIPKYLLPFVDLQVYYDNLKQSKVYDKVQEEYYQIRINRKKSNNREQYDNEEFIEWLKDNKTINELLISLIQK